MAQTKALSNADLNTVLTPLSLTSTADSYTFSITTGNQSVFTIQFTADAAFSYSNASGGNFFPVASGSAINLDVRGPAVFYFKTASTATLSALVIDCHN